ncbi:hypothetical protein PR048_032269 [Dryococelus australis]|uniref:Uncharacterized protein n=1 Tax=Dryococelus australis TaxID=614101 RepID=A0ABQ9G4L0_9NEOP|nr:hypothetical protein PR048_032269 [Dryococelus australis]
MAHQSRVRLSVDGRSSNRQKLMHLIVHHLPERGRSFLPCDQDLAHIGKRKKSEEVVYAPDQWYEMVEGSAERHPRPSCFTERLRHHPPLSPVHLKRKTSLSMRHPFELDERVALSQTSILEEGHSVSLVEGGTIDCRGAFTTGSAIVSHQGEPGSIPGGVAPPPPKFSRLGIVQDDTSGRRSFSGISRCSRPFIPALLHTHLVSPSATLKISLLKRRPNPCTPLNLSHQD